MIEVTINQSAKIDFADRTIEAVADGDGYADVLRGIESGGYSSVSVISKYGTSEHVLADGFYFLKRDGKVCKNMPTTPRMLVGIIKSSVERYNYKISPLTIRCEEKN